jgi:hypothetical protein
MDTRKLFRLTPATVVSHQDGLIKVVLDDGTPGEFMDYQCRRVERGTRNPYLNCATPIRLQKQIEAGERLVFAHQGNVHGEAVRCIAFGFKKFYDQHLAAGPLEEDPCSIDEQLLGEKSAPRPRPAFVPRRHAPRTIRPISREVLATGIPVVTDLDLELGYTGKR